MIGDQESVKTKEVNCRSLGTEHINTRQPETLRRTSEFP